MTKIKIESLNQNQTYNIPVQSLGSLALGEKHRQEYSRKYRVQDHGSRQAARFKDKPNKSLAARREEFYDEINDLSSPELFKEANEILAQNGFDENGQKLPKSELIYSSDDDYEERAVEELMGSSPDLDELIRSSRIGDRHRREKSATLADNPDNDPEEYALDGFNVKEERPNQ